MAQPAARLGDQAAHVWAAGAVKEGCATVRINGLPAARMNDKIQHGLVVEAIASGEPTVRIGGQLAARVGDKVGCGGCIAQGSPNVRIGKSAPGNCLEDASRSSQPYVRQVTVDTPP